MLDALQTPAGSAAQADAALNLARVLYPICRSITGEGVRRSLELLRGWIPLIVHEVPTGTAAFDWEVPREWNVREAWIADSQGRRLVDFAEHTLHLVSYSTAFHGRLSRDELDPHLHSLPDHPDWIPYRTSYYRDDWGFCLAHRRRAELGEGPFEVRIDADLAPGHLTYAECVIPGRRAEEGLVYTHTCHPSLANDNLSGIAVAAVLARAMLEEEPALTWRFVFGPGTIGSLTWLARNEAALRRIRAGLVIGLVGDRAPLTFKRSRNGGTLIDRVAEHVLAGSPNGERIVDFEPYGYDERQFCSPGFDLPVGRLTRSSNGTYPEYHTSADNMDFIAAPALAGSIRTAARMLSVIDRNRRLLNLSPKGEPRLGKRGLYRSLGGTAPGDFDHALLWVLSLSDGQHDLVGMAQRAHIPFERVHEAAAALERAGLVRGLDHEERDLL